MLFSQVYSGKTVDIEPPRPAQIDIVDIGFSLSRIPRFNGHTIQTYSVAEHSIRVASKAPPELKLEALLHDAHEAYLGDITRPVKIALGETYNRLATLFDHAVRRRFNLPLELSPEIREIDDRMLSTEKYNLLNQPDREWTVGVEPYPLTIEPMDELAARHKFFSLFRQYSGGQA